MAIDPAALLALELPDTRQRYRWHDAALYALGTGAGLESEDADALAFVDERTPLALPTFAAVLGFDRFWIERGEFGIDPAQVLHAEQGVRWSRALPPAGEIVRRTRVVGVEDRGEGRGAFVLTEDTIRDAATGTLLATLTATILCRAEGGCGSAGRRREPLEPPPDRAPNLVRALPGSVQQALIYRLSGDLNPLHFDAHAARAAGFARPILHGLATFGAAGRVLLATLGGNRPERARAQSARFSGVLYPGESTQLRLWRQSAGEVRYELWAPERGARVLASGVFEYEQDVRTS